MNGGQQPSAGQKHTYQIAFVNNGQETYTLIYVNFAVIADDKLAARSIAALKRFFSATDIVLVAVDITQQPHFAGPRHLVEPLRGRKISDFRWQTAVVG